MEDISLQYELDQNIITDLLSGSRTDFGEFYAKYAPALWGFILKMTEERKTAEAILQQAFVEIWNRKGHYNRSSGPLFPWMLKITKNVALFHQASLHIAENGENQNSVAFVNINDNSHDKDSDLQSKVFRMMYFSKYGVKDVARILNIDEEKIKMMLRYSIKKLNAAG